MVDPEQLRNSNVSMRLEKIFVQHVAKTAGTSLLYFLEPNFSYHSTVTSQRFWNHWSSDPALLEQTRNTVHPMLVRMPPSLAANVDYVHGHFKDFFRQVMFGDWFAIGTCRAIDERLISSLDHQLRDATMDKRLVEYLRGGKASFDWVLKGLINNSHLGFYATVSTRSILWEKDADFHVDLPVMAVQALANIDRYDYIIDSSDFADHCQHLAEGLRYSSNIGKFNTRRSFGRASAFTQNDMAILRDKFGAFFEIEDAIYAKLKAKSLASLNQPLAPLLEKKRRLQAKTVTLLPDCADITGMSVALPAGLHGWENEFYREILPGASLNNIEVTTGNYVAYAWLWSADPERFRQIKLRVTPCANQVQAVTLIENPSKHLWLVSTAFTVVSDGYISMMFDEPDQPTRTFWLGAKFYYQDDTESASE